MATVYEGYVFGNINEYQEEAKALPKQKSTTILGSSPKVPSKEALTSVL